MDLGAVAAPDVRWGIGAAAANTGFAKVVTAPAAKPLRATTIGPLASGAAPVIGLDGYGLHRQPQWLSAGFSS